MLSRFTAIIFAVAGFCLAAVEQSCTADGVCTNKVFFKRLQHIYMFTIFQDDVVIPKYANKDGRPPEGVDECVDRHPECNRFVSLGECEKNPGWMIINCASGCEACHLRDAKVRCSRETLNTTETAALAPGQLNSIFERIERNENNQFGNLTIVSRDPWVIVFHDFVKEVESEAILGSVQTWERSTDTGSANKFGETGRVLSQGRTSSNAWCRAECEANPYVRNVMKRIEYTTTVPIPNFESFQVLRYELDQKYNPHHDTGASQFRLPCGPRILTFFLYLSDVEEGGETAFPKLDIAVKPKKGQAVLWPGVKNENPGLIDYRYICRNFLLSPLSI